MFRGAFDEIAARLRSGLVSGDHFGIHQDDKSCMNHGANFWQDLTEFRFISDDTDDYWPVIADPEQSFPVYAHVAPKTHNALLDSCAGHLQLAQAQDDGLVKRHLLPDVGLIDENLKQFSGWRHLKPAF